MITNVSIAAHKLDIYMLESFYFDLKRYKIVKKLLSYERG